MFLNFTESLTQEQWNTFSLYTNDDDYVGRYVLDLKITLPSFPMIQEAVSSITIEVLKRPYNRLPYFSPRLPPQLSIDLASPTLM